MKKLLTTLPLLMIGCFGLAQGSMKKAEKVSAQPVEYPKAQKATSSEHQEFDEEAFIEEYLIGNELPMTFPDRSQYEDRKNFMRDVKIWVKENPALVHEHKRIK